MFDERLLPLVKAGYSKVHAARYANMLPDEFANEVKDMSPGQARTHLMDSLAASKATTDLEGEGTEV